MENDIHSMPSFDQMGNGLAHPLHKKRARSYEQALCRTGLTMTVDGLAIDDEAVEDAVQRF